MLLLLERQAEGQCVAWREDRYRIMVNYEERWGVASFSRCVLGLAARSLACVSSFFLAPAIFPPIHSQHQNALFIPCPF